MFIETELTDILMNFVSFMVVAETSKWFGLLFEKYLKTFYEEVTTKNPSYLKIQVTHLDKVIAYI